MWLTICACVTTLKGKPLSLLRWLHLVALRMASPSTSRVGALEGGGEVNGGRRPTDAAFVARDRDYHIFVYTELGVGLDMHSRKCICLSMWIFECAEIQISGYVDMWKIRTWVLRRAVGDGSAVLIISADTGGTRLRSPLIVGTIVAIDYYGI